MEGEEQIVVDNLMRLLRSNELSQVTLGLQMQEGLKIDSVRNSILTYVGADFADIDLSSIDDLADAIITKNNKIGGLYVNLHEKSHKANFSLWASGALYIMDSFPDLEIESENDCIRHIEIRNIKGGSIGKQLSSLLKSMPFATEVYIKSCDIVLQNLECKNVKFVLDSSYVTLTGCVVAKNIEFLVNKETQSELILACRYEVKSSMTITETLRILDMEVLMNTILRFLAIQNEAPETDWFTHKLLVKTYGIKGQRFNRLAYQGYRKGFVEELRKLLKGYGYYKDNSNKSEMVRIIINQERFYEYTKDLALGISD